MARAIYTVDEYTVSVRKKETIWIVFNKAYNEVHNLKMDFTDELRDRYLEKDETDYQARDEFLKYMVSNFPDTKLIEVMDLVSAGYLVYPYLGSLIIDIDKDSEVFKVLSEKYDTPTETDDLTNRTLWAITYEEALLFLAEKEKMYDNL